MKHVEHLTEINELRKVASCRLYSENKLVMQGPMNVKSVSGQPISPIIKGQFLDS